MQALSFILDDASETSKSTGVKAGRRKVDDSGKKKTDFSFFKKKDKTVTLSSHFWTSWAYTM